MQHSINACKLQTIRGVYRLARIMAAGGPGVKAAANKALDGTTADLHRFLEVGQFKAREDDDRVAVAQAMANGGPEVKSAAQAVLSGPSSGLREFSALLPYVWVP